MLWLNVIGLLAIRALGLNLRDLIGAGQERDGRAEQPAARGQR